MLLERLHRSTSGPVGLRSMSLLGSSSESAGACKRRKIRGVVGIKGISTEALVAVLKEAKAHDLDITSRWQVGSLVSTEFGKVHHNIELPLEAGGTFAWKVCRMDRLLLYFATESAEFRASLVRALDNAGPRPLSCILYLDEIVPGNILRPDNRRKFWAIYVSFEELGRERLFLEQYWLPLAVLRSSIVGDVAGGLSNCFRLLVRSLLLDPLAAASAGFALDLGGGARLIRLRISSVVGDEAALKSVWNSKGAAGTRPCFFCGNCVSMSSQLAAQSPDLIDISCSDPSLFQLCEDADVWSAYDHLAAQQPRLNRTDFAILEQASGHAGRPA